MGSGEDIFVFHLLLIYLSLYQCIYISIDMEREKKREEIHIYIYIDINGEREMLLPHREVLIVAVHAQVPLPHLHIDTLDCTRCPLPCVRAVIPSIIAKCNVF